MSNTTLSSLGPAKTPPTIAKLIAWTSVICVTVSLLNGWIQNLFNIPGPEAFLSLSYWGMTNGMFWQPLSYLFVMRTYNGGISFNFLISLGFQMYTLWLMGTMVLEKIGSRPFLKLYFLSGILSGLLALAVMPLFNQYTFLSGPTAALLGVFTVWAMMYPDLELLIFFILPVKAKWLWVFTLGALTLINVSQLDIINLIHQLSAVALSYCGAILFWNLESPFPQLEAVDRFLVRIQTFFQKKKESSIKAISKKTKIIDISTGEPVIDDDDAFIDAMLSKISHSGEKSLSWSERERMKAIAERKKKGKAK